MDVSEHQYELDRIAERFTQQLRKGENPSIREWVAEFSGPTEQLESLLSSILLVENLKRKAHSSKRQNAKAFSLPEFFDDYRIVREIGRGGMGVVYEAVHLPLSRRVAIKVFSGDILAQEQQLARFKLEARAAAKLRHPSIVPVYGVGSANGFHYFVMDLISGRSLRAHLSALKGENCPDLPTLSTLDSETNTDFSSENALRGKHVGDNGTFDAKLHAGNYGTSDYVKWAANTTRLICSALHYAHEEGVLHRDIKPANLLLDESGHVWVADFGLAKLEEQHMTKTGDVVGTPQYLPPESLEGKYDERSEVYAVGLTLFELLTLRPAIAGINTGDTLRAAMEGVNELPDACVQWVPRDLSTILFKALALEPEDRYPNPSAFREDLECLLNARPISARRSNVLERTRRWAQREPVVACLTGLSFGLMLMLAAVAGVGYFRAKRTLAYTQGLQESTMQALAKESAALALAQDSRLLAESNLQVASAIFEEIVGNYTARGLETENSLLGEYVDNTAPEVSEQDAKLLQSLLKFFDKLATSNSQQLMPDAALAARRIGDIYVTLGEIESAQRAYQNALDRYEQLGTSSGEVETPLLLNRQQQALLAQAQILNELALIAGYRGQPWRNEEIYQAINALIPESTPSDGTELALAFARAHRLFASFGERSGLDDAINAQNPRGRRPRFGEFLRKNRDLAALEWAKQALIALSPEASDLRVVVELARCHRCRGEILSRAKQSADSSAAINEALVLLEDLLVEESDSEFVQFELATTLLSKAAVGSERKTRALRAMELAKKLQAKHPDTQSYVVLTARAFENIGQLRADQGELSDAQQAYTEASRIFGEISYRFPDQAVYRTQQSQALESLAKIHARRGNLEQAQAILERAIRRLQIRGSSAPPSQVARIQLQRMRKELARMIEKRSTINH